MLRPSSQTRTAVPSRFVGCCSPHRAVRCDRQSLATHEGLAGLPASLGRFAVVSLTAPATLKILNGVEPQRDHPVLKLRPKLMDLSRLWTLLSGPAQGIDGLLSGDKIHHRFSIFIGELLDDGKLFSELPCNPHMKAIAAEARDNWALSTGQLCTRSAGKREDGSRTLLGEGLYRLVESWYLPVQLCTRACASVVSRMVSRSSEMISPDGAWRARL